VKAEQRDDLIFIETSIGTIRYFSALILIKAVITAVVMHLSPAWKPSIPAASG
jgi:hypothetical protein